jgi:hypothetical protein
VKSLSSDASITEEIHNNKRPSRADTFQEKNQKFKYSNLNKKEVYINLDEDKNDYNNRKKFKKNFNDQKFYDDNHRQNNFINKHKNKQSYNINSNMNFNRMISNYKV